MRVMRGALLATAGFVFAACGSGSSEASDGSAPQIRIDAPADKSTVGGQVSINVTAIDDFGVDKVRILIDGTLLTELFEAPYHAGWATAALANGTVHIIRAEALDHARNIGFTTISVTVENVPQ